MAPVTRHLQPGNVTCQAAPTTSRWHLSLNCSWDLQSLRHGEGSSGHHTSPQRSHTVRETRSVNRGQGDVCGVKTEQRPKKKKRGAGDGTTKRTGEPAPVALVSSKWESVGLKTQGSIQPCIHDHSFWGKLIHSWLWLIASKSQYVLGKRSGDCGLQWRLAKHVFPHILILRWVFLAHGLQYVGFASINQLLHEAGR